MPPSIISKRKSEVSEGLPARVGLALAGWSTENQGDQSRVAELEGCPHRIQLETSNKLNTLHFLAPEFLSHCRAESFARPIHGVANLRRRSDLRCHARPRLPSGIPWRP
jgi:hypothetical protein